MCEIQGLSSNPAEAYQQGFRDGRVETLHAEELAATDSQQLKVEIASALYEYDDLLHNPYPNPLDGLLSRLRRLSTI